jgi:hypothetical protein
MSAARRVLGVVLVAWALIGTGLPALAGPCGPGCGHGRGSASVSWVASDWFDREAKDWRLGMGFDLAASYQLCPLLDFRADWGLRWADGTEHLVTGNPASPDFGGRPGDLTRRLRTMPLTFDLVHRIPAGHCHRCCSPYLGLGIGFYDLQVRFRPQIMTGSTKNALDHFDGQDRVVNIYRYGWNMRLGADMMRPSGLFLRLESALHYVNTPAHWTPAYDVSMGIGTILPRP